MKQDINYYKNIINSTNGLLFPGGGQNLNNSLYADFGKIVWDLAIEKQKTEYYPIWGTCLGFELLSQLAVGKNWLKRCNSQNVAMNLNFAKEVIQNKKTRLFRNADPKIIDV